MAMDIRNRIETTKYNFFRIVVLQLTYFQGRTNT